MGRVRVAGAEADLEEIFPQNAPERRVVNKGDTLVWHLADPRQPERMTYTVTVPLEGGGNRNRFAPSELLILARLVACEENPQIGPAERQASVWT